jgi:quercetin dioxygenase-like cupin family protein
VPRQPPEDLDAASSETFARLAEGVPTAELSAEQRASMRARVMGRAVDVPPPETETIRGEDISWRQAWPKVWVKVLKRDARSDLQITLIRFEPGGCIPGHMHRKDEECYVLEGEVTVGSHRVGAGDFHIARAGAHHPDLLSRGGALVMLRSEHH